MCVEAWSTPTGAAPDPVYICFHGGALLIKSIRSQGAQLLSLAHAQSLRQGGGISPGSFYLQPGGCELC